MSLEICLRGTDAAALEPLALDLLRRLGGGEPTRQVEESPASEASRDREGRLALAITMIVGLPGALNDSLSLNDRLHLTEAVTAFLAQVQASASTVVLRLPLAPPLDLSGARPDDVMNYLKK